MSRRLRVIALLIVPGILMGQGEKNTEKTTPQATTQPYVNWVTRLVRLQHADPRQVANLLASSGVSPRFDDVLRVIVISGSPSQIDSVEKMIKEIDAETEKTSDSNVQVKVYVIGASDSAIKSQQLPADLQPVVKQLQATFPYKDYALLETIVGRSRVGENCQLGGALPLFEPNTDGPMQAVYTLRFTVSGIVGSGGKQSVRINMFNFVARIPYSTSPSSSSVRQYQQSESAISNNFDIAGGQKVVIGNAGVVGNNALFLAVEAKVVN